MDREALEVIRRVVLEEAERLGIRVAKIILFGSRARGDAREDSDYDVLVVVEGKLEWKKRKQFSLRVRRRLYRMLGKPVDLIVEDRSVFAEKSTSFGTIEEIVLKEGLVV